MANLWRKFPSTSSSPKLAWFFLQRRGETRPQIADDFFDEVVAPPSTYNPIPVLKYYYEMISS